MDDEGAESGSDVEDLLVSDDSDSDDEGENRNANHLRRPWVRVYDPEADEPWQVGVEFPLEGSGAPVDPPPVGTAPVNYFKMLLVDEDEGDLIDIIVQETNRYAEQHLAARRGPLTQYSRLRDWHPTTNEEISALIGVVLSMGLCRKRSMAEYFNDGDTSFLTHTPSYGKIFSRNRLQIVHRMLHLVDNTNVPLAGQPNYDPTDKFKPVLNILNASFAKHYRLSQNVVADERMVAFEGRNAMKINMPRKKSTQWGAKMWVLADSPTAYTYRTLPYKGRRYDPVPPEGQGHNVVMRLLDGLLDIGHHVTLDRFFSSPGLAHALWERRTTTTGTVMLNRRGMPPSLRTAFLVAGEVTSRRQGPLLDELLYSLTEQPHGPAGDQATLKPAVVHSYQANMGGVDKGDQLLANCAPHLSSFKLWKKILWNLLTVASINAYIIYSQATPNPCSKKTFLRGIQNGLVGEWRQTRRVGRVSGAPQPDRLTGRHFIETMEDGMRRQCAVCGAANREARVYRGNRISTWCRSCGKPMCKSPCFRRYHTNLVPHWCYSARDELICKSRCTAGDMERYWLAKQCLAASSLVYLGLFACRNLNSPILKPAMHRTISNHIPLQCSVLVSYHIDIYCEYEDVFVDYTPRCCG